MRSSVKKTPMLLSYASPPPARTWMQIRRNAALDLVDLWCGFRGFLLVVGFMGLFLGPRLGIWDYSLILVLVALVCETIVALARRQRTL